MSTARTLTGYWLGCRKYQEILELQERLHHERRQKLRGDTVLLLEHLPVITLGRGTKPDHLLCSESSLQERGIDLVTTARGGDVTLHAPGQLVCYPILDLAPDRQDVRAYVNLLTRVMQALVADVGITAGTIPGYVGLWVDSARHEEWRGDELAEAPMKIGAIGVKISRWVTSHGFALNLSLDLSTYELIVPCGIREYGVTSVKALLGKAPDVRETAARALGLLGRELGALPSPLLDWDASSPAN